VEAYKLLTERLREFVALGRTKTLAQIESEAEVYEQDSRGKQYVINFRVDGSRLHGSIHDRDSRQFSLLEEFVDFED